MVSLLGNSRKHDIVVFNSGRIDISARIAKMLNIQDGNILDIMIDKGELLLYVKHRNPVFGKHEAVVKFSNRYGKHCRLHSKKIAQFIIDKTNGLTSVRLSIGEPVFYENEMMLPIITKLEL